MSDNKPLGIPAPDPYTPEWRKARQVGELTRAVALLRAEADVLAAKLDIARAAQRQAECDLELTKLWDGKP